ncbi:MAG: binding-protein-dependent transport system inner rane component [Acidimicrobiaceae bacterium]|nr:binding-protein-dependent transport system inner rane component [Acidimicrobiaceae bacterium]
MTVRQADYPPTPASKVGSSGRRLLGTPAKTKGRRSAQRKLALQGLLFVAPMVALVAAFVVVPLVRVIQLSFTAWTGLGTPQPVGLANYRYLYSWSSFRTVLVNNAILLSGLVLWVLLPFLLATVIYKLRRAALVRTIIFTPTILPPIVVGEVFSIMLAHSGPLNIVLRHLGLGVVARDWLTTPYLVLLSVIWMISWATFGVGVQFFSAALVAIPSSYIEAAQIDGARWAQIVWNIYRPVLRPVMQFWFLVLTISTVTYFFPWIFGLTQGGPGYESTTLDYMVYLTGITNGEYGLGSAISVILLLFLLVLLLIYEGGRRIRRAYG